jgi:hypothetical protein
MITLPFSSGIPRIISRSNLPALLNAGSIVSGLNKDIFYLLVAPITKTNFPSVFSIDISSMQLNIWETILFINYYCT